MGENECRVLELSGGGLVTGDSKAGTDTGRGAVTRGGVQREYQHDFPAIAARSRR